MVRESGGPRREAVRTFVPYITVGPRAECLTSQWSGQLRAAHSAAAQGCVRCQKEVTELRHSYDKGECESNLSLPRQGFEGSLQCASLFVSLVGPVSRWQRSADVLYINEELAQGADAVQRGATPPRLDGFAPTEAETARASGNVR